MTRNPYQRRRTRQLLVAILICAAQPALALTLEFPGPAAPSGGRTEAMTTYRLPIGPFAAGALPSRLIEAPLDQTAYRITAPGITSLQLMQPLRAQVAAAGYTVIFECEATGCGGFDFRYGIDVLPEPDMHVDLGDFHFLAAERATPDGVEAVSLLVSRSADQGFVQLTRLGQSALPPPDLTASTKTPGVARLAAPIAPIAPAAQAADLGNRLLSGGSIALDDLIFASGDASLAKGDFPSLAELAAWLRANPDRQIALVGHTDASGSLDANIVLSRQRAESVRARLIDEFDLPGAQIDAQGVGYLSPRDSNLSEEGRTRNRRVEVMLTSTR